MIKKINSYKKKISCKSSLGDMCFNSNGISSALLLLYSFFISTASADDCVRDYKSETIACLRDRVEGLESDRDLLLKHKRRDIITMFVLTGIITIFCIYTRVLQLKLKIRGDELAQVQPPQYPGAPGVGGRDVEQPNGAPPPYGGEVVVHNPIFSEELDGSDSDNDNA